MAKGKLLVVTYYWPPSGGGGVQRWLFFTKFLAQLGWEITVYTVNSDEYPTKDSSLENEVPDGIRVIRSEIWEPFDLYRKVTGKSKEFRVQASFANKEKGKAWLENLAVWVRSNFFIPDARKFWIKPSVKRLKKLVEAEQFDWVISSGPPHSCHIIGQQLAEKTGIKWLADFRDPWTGIDYFEQLKLTPSALKKHQKMERDVLTEATVVITVGPTLAEELGALAQQRVHVFTNGFLDWIPPQPNASNKKTLLHVGTLGPARNHASFWQALVKLQQNYPDVASQLEVLFVGNADASVLQDIKEFGLDSLVRIESYVPSNEVHHMLATADALYLPVNDSKNAKGILTGKFFEYLSARKPVLAIGPLDGDINNILQETGVGKMVAFGDATGFAQLLQKDLLEGSGTVTVNASTVENYKREAIAARLSALLEKY